MNVQCSWKVPDGKPVSDAVIWSDGEESADLEDEVAVENCIMLEAPDKGEGAYPTAPACQLLFSCQPPFHISRISVLCEARVLEVYGHHGEYLKTIKNELLEEAEDMIVFRGDVALERPLALCSIKFAGLRTLSEMWLYGIKISRTKVESNIQNVAIPLAAVEQRLSEMGLALSNKAEAFKQLVEKCQKSPICGQPDITYIISTLQQCNLIKNKSPSPQNMQQLSESLEYLTRGVERRDSQNNLKEISKSNTPVYKEPYQYSPNPQTYYVTSAATSPMFQERCVTSSQTDEEYINLEERLKAHVHEQIHDLDKRLWDRIDQRFQEIEAKLLCKLDEIESFVKPQGIGGS